MENSQGKWARSLSPTLITTYSNEHLDAQLHRFILQIQGGQLLPEHVPIQDMQRVLDLGCGTGEWIFDMARQYLRQYFYGIDSNEEALRLAQERSDASNLFRVQWRQMDAAESIPIPDRYLDLVYTRRSSSWLKPTRWPGLIEDCARILAPGGWITIVELELGELSSPAFMKLIHAMLQARARLGLSLDASGRTFGFGANIYRHLRQAPFKNVGYDLHVIDVGFMESNSGPSFISLALRYMLSVKQAIVEMGILDRRTLEALIEQMDEELKAPDLCGWGMILSVYGQRDEREGW